MIADFTTPVAPNGWLELDGSVISTSTYSGLYSVMTIAASGTRTNGSSVITSIASTSNFRVGYYIFGTGFSSGTTILSVDSPTQITVSNSAGSSGTSAFAVSPWLLNTGTIKLPDVTTAGRFRRSRTSSTKVGDLQADQNQAHNHNFTSGTTDSQGSHTHTVTDPGHTHTATILQGGSAANLLSQVRQGGNDQFGVAGSPITINTATTGISLVSNGAHTHTVTGSISSSGSTEARPLSIVVLTCVKT